MDCCEKFENFEWKQLAKLPEPATKVGVAEHKNSFYISGWPSARLFCYDISSDTFTTLNFELPAPFNSAHAIINSNLFIMRGASS